MNIREALAAEHSKRQTMAIVEYVGDSDARFAELMKIFLGNEYRPTQRAAWAVNYCVERHPELIKPYWGKIVKQIVREDAHVAVKRNVLRMLQFVEVPKRLQGRIFDICYGLVESPDEPVAVKVHALTVAANIAGDKPHLLEDLRLLPEKYTPHLTKAFAARSRKIFPDLAAHKNR